MKTLRSFRTAVLGLCIFAGIAKGQTWRETAANLGTSACVLIIGARPEDEDNALILASPRPPARRIRADSGGAGNWPAGWSNKSDGAHGSGETNLPIRAIRPLPAPCMKKV